MVFTYKDAGVSVDAGDQLVDWLSSSPFGKKHHQDKIVSGIGGFASLFRVDFSKMQKPCLVTCTDGVGTKVKLASHYGQFSTVGQDLVAMCVNDMVCSGATPLLFLDYYATGRLELAEAKEFLQGVQKACDESLCALVGGETAEMPGVYQNKDFDCAGFAVGVVDEVTALGPGRVQVGDQVLGISSSGFHSNGYSLLRKVFAREIESKDQNWANNLLKPTALYVQLMEKLKAHLPLHAVAHITGQGIENVPRVLPKNMAWHGQPWAWPESFKEVQKRTQMSDAEMLRTLNCGVGLVVVLPHGHQKTIEQMASHLGFDVYPLGEVTAKKDGDSDDIINL